jgi:hypothetical protein
LAFLPEPTSSTGTDLEKPLERTSPEISAAVLHSWRRHDHFQPDGQADSVERDSFGSPAFADQFSLIGDDRRPRRDCLGEKLAHRLLAQDQTLRRIQCVQRGPRNSQPHAYLPLSRPHAGPSIPKRGNVAAAFDQLVRRNARSRKRGQPRGEQTILDKECSTPCMAMRSSGESGGATYTSSVPRFHCPARKRNENSCIR